MFRQQMCQFISQLRRRPQTCAVHRWVVADDVADLGEEAADAVQHVGPSPVWRRTTSHSVRRQRAGLVDDLLRHPDLADVVQQRARTPSAAGSVAEAELVGDRDRELDDAAAVVARVAVVGADQLPSSSAVPR